MNIKQLVLAWLMLLSLLMLVPAGAANLPNQTINGIQKNIKPAIPANPVIKKTSPANAIHLNTTLACPKLFAKNLRVVRVVPQPARGGVQTYRFILDGSIANRGATGLANAGLNVTQSVQGRPAKRIALKLFKQQVRKKQLLNVSRDLRVTIQSDALSRAQASHTVFKMNVTNLRNEQGNCGEYNPTVTTLSAAQVSRALPAQVRGVSQQAGVITPARKSPAGTGFGVPAKKSLKTQKAAPGLNRQSLAKKQTGRPVIKPATPAMQMGKQKPRAKPAQGFAPKAATGGFGLNKPVTAVGGKSLLPPAATTGSRHVLHDDHAPRPRLGGFAPVAGVNAGVGQSPVTRSSGAPLIPSAHGYAIKVSYKIMNTSGSSVLVKVPSDEEFLFQFTFKNVGDAASPALVGHNRHVPGGLGVPGLNPGASYQAGLRMRVAEAHLSGDGATWFWGGMSITPRGSNEPAHIVASPDLRDNPIPVDGSVQLSIPAISNIHLKTNFTGYRGPKHVPEGISENVYADVTIRNAGNFTSRETTMDVSLNDRGDAVVHDKHAKFIKYAGQGPELTQHISIPAIGHGGSYTAHVVFRNVRFSLMDFDRQIREKSGPLTHKTTHAHYAAAAGNYACGFPASDDHTGHHAGWPGSHFVVQAALPIRSGSTTTASRSYRGQFKVGSFLDANCGVTHE